MEVEKEVEEVEEVEVAPSSGMPCALISGARERGICDGREFLAVSLGKL